LCGTRRKNRGQREGERDGGHHCGFHCGVPYCRSLRSASHSSETRATSLRYANRP
jgi:hypothetical protein